MRFFLKSIATFSFWRYALFSPAALGKLFATVGVLYLFMELLDFLGIYTHDLYSRYAIVPLLLFSAGYVVVTRRPITRVSYKLPNKDYRIEVRIGDLFEGNADVIVSANTTFDTSMADGLIATDSVQGQVAVRFFGSNTAVIDGQLDQELADVPFEERPDAPGKKREYPIGTVARVRADGRTFYFVAMARLNANGTASSTLREVEDALDVLWAYITEFGELKDLAIPLIGTGRGRIGFPRKKMVERIAQSFADGSKERIFSNRLTIAVQPQDAENFGVNLYEIRDYLAQSLHP